MPSASHMRGYESEEAKRSSWGRFTGVAVIVSFASALLAAVHMLLLFIAESNEQKPDDSTFIMGIVVSCLNVGCGLFAFALACARVRYLHLAFFFVSVIMTVLWIVSWALVANDIHEHNQEKSDGPPGIWGGILFLGILCWLLWPVLLVLAYFSYKDEYGVAFWSTDLW